MTVHRREDGTLYHYTQMLLDLQMYARAREEANKPETWEYFESQFDY